MKKFRIGEKIQLVFTGETALVEHYFDAETIIVRTGNVTFPVLIEHVVSLEKPKPLLDTPQRTTEQKPPPPPPNKDRIVEKIKAIGLHTEPDELPDRGIKVALQPFYHADLTVAYFLIHLINQSGKTLSVEYEMFLDTHEHPVFVLKSHVAGREAIILNSIDADELNDKPELLFHFQHTSKDLPNTYQNRFERIVLPKAKMLRNDPLETPIINGRAYLYTIDNELPKQNAHAPDNAEKSSPKIAQLDAASLKQQWLEQKFTPTADIPAPIAEKTAINAVVREIDLHIEQLLPHHKHLHKGEILRYQIATFEKEVETAIRRRELQMIVIHGLGKGKLREEIIKSLRNYPQVASFRNELHPKYGYGATEIFFEYSSK
ncbi:MAG: Smr/MutS family protein [Chitinophagales bacterium]|nr:Smr/MutS family protein [Chitinophagales bacterium]